LKAASVAAATLIIDVKIVGGFVGAAPVTTVPEPPVAATAAVVIALNCVHELSGSVPVPGMKLNVKAESYDTLSQRLVNGYEPAGLSVDGGNC